MSFQYMALYVGDYQRDTKHLSCCEHGIYLQLLMHCWSTKSPLPVEDRKLKSICNARTEEEVDAMHEVLNEFFIKNEDGWHNPRLSKEIDKAEAISNSRSLAGKKGGQANAKQMLSKSKANVSTHPHPHKEKYICMAQDVINYLNEVCKRNFKANNRHTQAHIIARLQEGFSVEDCKSVINNQKSLWLNDKKMSQYLTPVTLFREKKFPIYLANKPVEAKLEVAM